MSQVNTLKTKKGPLFTQDWTAGKLPGTVLPMPSSEPSKGCLRCLTFIQWALLWTNCIEIVNEFLFPLHGIWKHRSLADWNTVFFSQGNWLGNGRITWFFWGEISKLLKSYWNIILLPSRSNTVTSTCYPGPLGWGRVGTGLGNIHEDMSYVCAPFCAVVN